MNHLHDKKIAIVADWLIDFGGAELVIEEFLAMFPQAEIFTSVCFMKHKMLKWRKIHTSFLQKIPFFGRKHKLAGIFRPYAFRKFDFSDFDIVICSSSAESKNVALAKKWKNTKVFVYCHTPIRYYWSHYDEYLKMMEFGKILNPIAKFVLPKVVNWMRKLDLEAAAAVDVFWANSRTTADRIEKFYHRESEVIYPGIKTEEFSPTSEKWDFYLGIGRCIPYKKFDLLVDAFNQNGKKLILCTNTDNLLYHELQEKSKSNISWIFTPTKEKRNELYAQAKAFLFPPEEDFGLVPVEAMASGTPVIAYGVGGATETVVDEKTGFFFTPQTPDALNQIIEKFENSSLNQHEIIARGREFSTSNFRKKILESLQKYA